ncbi:uncharacterized protein LOC114331840 isoform X2 [Diabrotica virgifera virgifera]|uniref:Uncharacterized protein LOC114331840 isoform X2 n=1 Tax=Diabrotica virgifera virgifera TaxID=50390 RepID=A0A6P7FWQ6_DIAVI|nr:uncharacterized protein LOC114331840 isoform X2 [Diabrotica virgifera virgifera]
MDLVKAKKLLETNTSNKNIVNDMENFICQWKFKSEYDLTAICEDLDNLTEVLQENFFSVTKDINIFNSIHCVVYNLLWDNLKPVVRANWTELDLRVYQTSMALCKNQNFLVKQNDSSYCSVPYTAAIVELSFWDSHNSPLEKLNCLCTTYDTIFAELKSALVNLISKYSDKELEIPVINNEEIIPVITLVLIRSKLQYSVSNLYYIKQFGKQFLKDNNKLHIFETFEQAIENLLKIDHKQITTCSQGGFLNIDHLEAIRRITEINTDAKNVTKAKVSLNEENQKRAMELILQSTTADVNG